MLLLNTFQVFPCDRHAKHAEGVIDLDPVSVNGVRITALKLVNSDKVIIPEVRIY
jgi:hypothetical protein